MIELIRLYRKLFLKKNFLNKQEEQRVIQCECEREKVEY